MTKSSCVIYFSSDVLVSSLLFLLGHLRFNSTTNDVEELTKISFAFICLVNSRFVANVCDCSDDNLFVFVRHDFDALNVFFFLR
jgi:hypothetical protein